MTDSFVMNLHYSFLDKVDNGYKASGAKEIAVNTSNIFSDCKPDTSTVYPDSRGPTVQVRFSCSKPILFPYQEKLKGFESYGPYYIIRSNYGF